MGFRVRPDELHVAGQAAHDIAARVLEELRGVLGPSDQASDALRDFETGRALGECTEAWRALLTDLSTEMDASGLKLTQSAHAYQAADARAAAGS